MKEEDEKFCGIWVPEVRHGRATTGTGCAKLLELWLWSGMVRHGRAIAGTGRASFLAFSGSIFSRFLELCSDNYLQNNLKQQKTNKIKAIKCVGCLP